MPPTPIPVDYGICTVKLTEILGGHTESFTFGFHNTPSDTPLNNATNLSGQWMSSVGVAGLANTWELESFGVLQNVGGTLQSAVYPTATAGTRTTGSPPPAVSVRVTKTTLYAGRKHRGRFYLPNPYLEESTVSSGGTISTGAVASLQSALDDFHLHIDTTLGLPMYLLHHDLSTPDPVVALIVRSQVGTQRRRQPR